MQAIKVSGVKRIAELRSESCAMRRGHVHNACQRVSAIKDAIGTAKDFNPVDPGSEDSAKIDRASNFIQRNAIEKDFIELALASADKERFIDPALAVFQHLHTRNRTQRLQHFRLVLKLI